ncbi:LOW QUALITY PROTEIN: RING finger protein 17 [Pterocles gutturalis]
MGTRAAKRSVIGGWGRAAGLPAAGLPLFHSEEVPSLRGRSGYVRAPASSPAASRRLQRQRCSGRRLGGKSACRVTLNTGSAYLKVLVPSLWVMNSVSQRQYFKILEGFTELDQREFCHTSEAMSVEALHDDAKDEDTDLFGFSYTEMLEYLELKVKQEGDKVAETADRTFDELTASLLSRGEVLSKLQITEGLLKGDLSLIDYIVNPAVGSQLNALGNPRSLECKRKGLREEFVKSINSYTARIAEAKQVIEENKCLVGAIRIANECKSPSVRICDLTQVIYNLKLPVAELSRVNSLKEKIPPSVSHRMLMNRGRNSSRRKDLFNTKLSLGECLTICFMSYSGSAELVFVSHVVNPCHFYIRRCSQNEEARILEKKWENFCCNKSSYLLPSEARIFIKSKETGMCCRGTINELIPLRKNEQKLHGPIRYKVCDIALLEAFLIDLGSSVVLIFSGYVPAERPEPATLQTVETMTCLFVRKPDQHIEAELAAVPPLAVRCHRMFVPKNASEGWGEEAKTKFLGMVNNEVVLMAIFREENGVSVDLKKPPFNKISNNMPVSLKDALVFLDLARFRLRLPRDSLDLALPKKICAVYKHEYGNSLEMVCPVEGQACVAKQEDGSWYRAQIIGLTSHQEVKVKYVDFGNIANISLKDIRRVKKEFLSFPEKAIRCRLAYIGPYGGANEWNREAKKRFEEMTEDKLMLCSVVEILDNNILSVELFDSAAVHGRSFSINCQLIKEDLASYVPGYTESTAATPNEIWDTPLEEIPETSKALNLTNMEPVDEEDLKSLSKKQLQARISHVVSPSKIFVQWLSSESILKSLQEEMATTYKESQPQSVKWESSMHCAVYVHDLKQWQRGQIVRIVSETSAEVILYDSGAEKTVDVSCLRKLEENMKIIRTLAIECSLADIRPTGGSTQWTATACECLSYYLKGAQVKIIIQESDVACALPVKILCKDEMGQHDISEHLIKGLALRNRRTDKAGVPCSVSKEHLKVHLEQESTRLDGFNSKTPCARSSTAPEEDITVSESEQKSCKTYKSLLHSRRDEVYKSPIIPEAKIFEAVVSSIGRDGTIYIIPKSVEMELNKLMTEIQSNFKCLGLLEPYCWKKGEACVVRGSDTKWYRGKVVDVSATTLQVQYIDHGCIERIAQCHMYPTTLYTGIPPFCIPCQLYKTVPIGKFWQKDAVDCLQELLTNREVEVHVQELPDNPWGKLSISLYFGGMSLSSLMAHRKYCIAEECQDIQKLEQLEWDVPVSPAYVLPSLPAPGDTFPVRVTHLVSPKEVYICLDPSKNLMKQSATGGDASCDWESLDEALKCCNETVESLPLLTHFQTDMPCLVEYQDGLWYRAKVLSVKESEPVKILVQFVDYGNFSVVPASRVRHIPYYLLKYPVQAVRVLLAGFKPALYGKNVERIPYSPEWSMEALAAMMECVEGKQLSASIRTLSPEVTISLYEDDQNLVHMKLIEKGLADLDE